MGQPTSERFTCQMLHHTPHMYALQSAQYPYEVDGIIIPNVRKPTFREDKEPAEDVQEAADPGSAPSLSDSRPVLLTLLLTDAEAQSNFKPHKPQNNCLLLLSTIKTMGWHNRKTVQYVIKHNYWCPLIV